LDNDSKKGSELGEANALELLCKVEEPDSASFLGAVDVAEDLQDIVAFCVHKQPLGISMYISLSTGT